MKAFVTEMLAEYNKCDKSNIIRIEWLLHKALQLRQLCDDFDVYKNKDYEYLDMLIIRIRIDIAHWKIERVDLFI